MGGGNKERHGLSVFARWHYRFRLWFALVCCLALILSGGCALCFVLIRSNRADVGSLKRVINDRIRPGCKRPELESWLRDQQFTYGELGHVSTSRTIGLMVRIPQRSILVDSEIIICFYFDDEDCVSYYTIDNITYPQGP